MFFEWLRRRRIASKWRIAQLDRQVCESNSLAERAIETSERVCDEMMAAKADRDKWRSLAVHRTTELDSKSLALASSEAKRAEAERKLATFKAGLSSVHDAAVKLSCQIDRMMEYDPETSEPCESTSEQ